MDDFSAVLPRQDDAHKRGIELNELLSKYCDAAGDSLIKFVDYSSNFNLLTYFRYAETKDAEHPDCVHLSDNGNMRLQELLRVQVNRGLEELREKWTNDISVPEEQDWLSMRQGRFRMREPTRFKVTNYQPAKEAYENYIEIVRRQEQQLSNNNVLNNNVLNDTMMESHLDQQLKQTFPTMIIDTIKLSDKLFQTVAEESQCPICFQSTAESSYEAKKQISVKIQKYFSRQFPDAIS